MKVKFYVSLSSIVGAKSCTEMDFDKEDWESMTEDERHEYCWQVACEDVESWFEVEDE